MQKTENQAIKAAKGEIRSLEKFMKKAGVTLPYSTYMTAYAHMKGFTSWEALQGVLGRVAPVSERHPIAADYLVPVIAAEVHTDDRHYEVDFEANAWFAQASDEAILALADIDWGGDEEADAVALFFRGKDQKVTALFDYGDHVANTRAATGFECYVTEADALAWLHQHRPGLWAQVLCQENDVDLVEAQEDEIRGMWDWLDGQGNACDCSFATIEEAAINAVEMLGLAGLTTDTPHEEPTALTAQEGSDNASIDDFAARFATYLKVNQELIQRIYKEITPEIDDMADFFRDQVDELKSYLGTWAANACSDDPVEQEAAIELAEAWVSSNVSDIVRMEIAATLWLNGLAKGEAAILHELPAELNPWFTVSLENDDGDQVVQIRASDIQAHQGQTTNLQAWHELPTMDAESQVEDYALWFFKRRLGDQGEYQVTVL